MVCKGDWEPRQPQDFVRGVADIQAPPFSRPESSDYFLPVCTPLTSQAVSGYAVAGCAISGVNNGITDPSVVPQYPVMLLENNGRLLLETGYAIEL
jgi:hypothetical protein